MVKAIIEKLNNAAALHDSVTLSGEQAQRLVAEYQRLNMSLFAQPQEPVAKRWLVEKHLPSGSISWEAFEHELHARNVAGQYERAGSKTTVTPLYAQLQRIDADVVALAAEAGWNACRRQVYLLSEDYTERTHSLKNTDSVEGNFYRGQYDVAKSFAKSFSAFEARDCDYFKQIDFAALAPAKYGDE